MTGCKQQTTFLFIGGSKDGQWMEVKGPGREMVFPKLKEVPLSFYSPDFDLSTTVEIEQERYEQLPWAAQGYMVFVYVLKGLGPEGCLRMLFEGYRRPKGDYDGRVERW